MNIKIRYMRADSDDQYIYEEGVSHLQWSHYFSWETQTDL